MKKLIAMLFVVALCVPSIFADGEHSIYSVSYGSCTTNYLSVTTDPSDVAYIIVSSTGLASNTFVRLLDGGTTMFALLLGEAVQTTTIDLSNTPVTFATSLIIDSSVMDAAAHVTVVYRKRN